MSSDSSLMIAEAKRGLGALVPAPVSIGWKNLRTATPLLLMDLLALGTALGGITICGWFDPALQLPYLLGVQAMLVIPIGFLMFGLYPGCGVSAGREFRQITRVAGVTLLTLLVSQGVQASWSYNVIALGYAIGAIVFLVMGRSSARRLLARCDWWAQPVIVFGEKDQAAKICEEMERNRRTGLRPARQYDLAKMVDNELTREELIQSLCQRHASNRAILIDLPNDVEALCRAGRGIPYVNVALTDYPRIPSLWATTSERAGYLNIEFQDRLLCKHCRVAKRLMDLLISLCLLPFVFPLVLVLALLVKICSPGPAFFSQRRIGQGGRRFRMWKLRTMVPNADERLQAILEERSDLREEWLQTEKLKDDPRIFPLGAWLRKTSLDELPQLLNVIRGEMSLVGPRPIPDKPCSVHLYESSSCDGEMASYEASKPGVTGLWQISGRNNTTAEDRSAYDDYYARNWSPWLDMYILLRTLKTVLFQEGAY